MAASQGGSAPSEEGLRPEEEVLSLRAEEVLLLREGGAEDLGEGGPRE